MSWANGTLLALDTETTGPDPLTARIVTATAITMEPGKEPVVREWLADPGVEIPEEATAVHGVSTERAREHGRPPQEVVAEIGVALAAAWSSGWPVVAFNASYDLTVIDRELRRHDAGAGSLEIAGPVLDPFVIDRGIDRYRKGKRQLGAVCQYYGVTLENAHTSAADALAAGQLMLAIAAIHSKAHGLTVGELTLRELWIAQCRWYREQAASFETFLRRKKREDGATPEEIAAVVIERDWPIRPYTAELVESEITA